MSEEKLGRHTLINADCLEAMKQMEANTVDAVITDPPYGLGFMGKAWDALPPGEAWAQEVFRVCKPGAHLVAFGGTRTIHRLTTALEDAGWEIRDMFAWTYSSGFPKSLAVDKAIEKQRHDRAEVERVVRWMENARRESGVSRRQVEEAFGTVNIGQSIFTITPGSAPRVPTLEQVEVLLGLFNLDKEGVDPDIWSLILDLNKKKGQPGQAWQDRQVVGQYDGPAAGQTWRNNLGIKSNLSPKEMRGGPTTDEGRRWQGYGTALKPAYEPAVLARKPLDGTVAHNVLKWGTGAINIDAGRIQFGPGERYKEGSGHSSPESVVLSAGLNVSMSKPHALGRWPANTYHASKPSTSEREAGCHGLAQQTAGELTGGRQEGSAGLSSPRAGAGRTASGRGNIHPTVKPLAVMRQLVRLLAPQQNALVLEPFLGSGTTLLACEMEGHTCVGIEREADYLPIIRARFEGVPVLRRLQAGHSVSKEEGEALQRQGTLL